MYTWGETIVWVRNNSFAHDTLVEMLGLQCLFGTKVPLPSKSYAVNTLK